MPWRYRGADNKVEVVVDPHFSGSLRAMAELRPVWIVETDATRPELEASWLKGPADDLCEINRCPLPNPDDREGNLLLLLGMLDDHYYPYAGIIVHGLSPTPPLTRILKDEGFSTTESTGGTFSAIVNPEVRGEVIGRDVKK
jgi:hypothetical protein